MENARIIKIFLASPGDVAKERVFAANVVEEVNRDVALQYNTVLRLISSDRASPGFGKGGQAILNEKIAKRMYTYDLFLGIMWSKVGKRTPRAISGTVEEFKRAEKAFREYGKPEIWFFFRDASIPADSQEQLDQRGKVLKFRQELQTKSFTKSYKTYTEFKSKLREYLIELLFRLNQQRTPVENPKRPRVTSPTPSSPKTRSPKGAQTKPQKKKPLPRQPKVQEPVVVKEVKDWAMINKEFYPLKGVKIQGDKTATLRLSPLTLTQASQLRSLKAQPFARGNDIACAYEQVTAFMQVQDVESESIDGETTVIITLTQTQHSNSGMYGTGFVYQSYSPNDIALCARFVLFGEPLPLEFARLMPMVHIGTQSDRTEVKENIFPKLWTQLQVKPKEFLPKAWLWAAFVLKMGNVVDDILALELGPISRKTMIVHFRAERRQLATRREPVLIDIKGGCKLEE